MRSCRWDNHGSSIATTDASTDGFEPDDKWVVVRPGLHPVFSVRTMRAVRAIIVSDTRREAVVGSITLGSPTSAVADVHAHKIRVEASYHLAQPVEVSLPRLVRAFDRGGQQQSSESSSRLAASVRRAGLDADSVAADVIRDCHVWESADKKPTDAIQVEINDSVAQTLFGHARFVAAKNVPLCTVCPIHSAYTYSIQQQHVVV